MESNIRLMLFVVLSVMLFCFTSCKSKSKGESGNYTRTGEIQPGSEAAPGPTPFGAPVLSDLSIGDVVSMSVPFVASDFSSLTFRIKKDESAWSKVVLLL